VSKDGLTREEFNKLKASGSPFYKFRVVTGSMAPLIPVGSLIVVDQTADIRLNDIIVFFQDNKLVCHIFWHQNRRATKGGKEVLVTRPLHGEATDLAIYREDILGKVQNFKLSFWTILRLRLRSRFKSRR
jgi:signal peptidase I